MTAPEYFIGSINLAGARFVSGDEIYRAAAAHAVNAFWLQPNEIEARIEAIPAILDATVVLEWPAGVVRGRRGTCAYACLVAGWRDRLDRSER